MKKLFNRNNKSKKGLEFSEYQEDKNLTQV